MERSPFTTTGQRTVAPVDRAFSLSAAPQMPPGRKPSIRRACSAPSNLQSTIHTSRVGVGGEDIKAVNYHQRQCTTQTKTQSCWPLIRPLEAYKRAICDRCPRFSSPNVCCCCDAARDTQRIQASSAETGRDWGGGGVKQRRHNVSAFTVWAGWPELMQAELSLRAWPSSGAEAHCPSSVYSGIKWTVEFGARASVLSKLWDPEVPRKRHVGYFNFIQFSVL